MNETARWTCPTCNTGVDTPYCATCGERPLRQRDLTLRGLAQHMFEAFTNIDNKLFRSFRSLLTHPGELTVAYLQGRRIAYLRPVQLFLISNVLFFACESLTGGQIFTTSLNSHLHTQPWSEYAPQLVADRLATLHTTLERYAPSFDRAIALKARSLIIFMALAFAIVPMLVFALRKRPLVAHAVFSLHFYSFLLLLLCVATSVQAFNGMLGGSGFAADPFDYFISIALLLASAVYLYVAGGTVYGASGFARVLQTLVLTVSVAAIVLGYRFVLLLITLYTTS